MSERLIGVARGGWKRNNYVMCGLGQRYVKYAIIRSARVLDYKGGMKAELQQATK